MMEITLRTKSANLSADAIPAIAEVLTWPNAVEHVFTGLHSPEYLVKKLGLSYSAKEATMFANELRYQFSKHFPEEPLNLEVTDGNFLTAESTAFRALSERVTEFVARRILERIHEYSFFDMKAIERAGFLLRATTPDNPSEEQLKKAEQLNFGGLRELFNNRVGSYDDSYYVANWLKSAHKEISELFDEFMTIKYPHFNQKETITVPTVVKAPSPEPVTPMEVTTQPQTESISLEEPVEPTVTALSPATILENAEAIRHFLAYARKFLAYARKLRNAGVSPESLLENAEAIRHFLAYARKLKNAGVSPESLLEKEVSVQDFLKASKTLMT